MVVWEGNGLEDSREVHRSGGGPMGESFRVVMVEDVESDADLAERELKRAGLAVRARRVEREEDFRRELAEFRPHVILSDFSMPQFNGMSALRIAREIVPEVPFIFVSGTLGEDYAIRALKNGATDYVLKRPHSRLPPTIAALSATAMCRTAGCSRASPPSSGTSRSPTAPRSA